MPRLTTAYPLRTILAKAWCLARAGARRFGGTARAYLVASLRQAWAEVRTLAATIAAQRQRVLAAVAALKFEASPFGVAIRRREETAFEVKMQAHRAELRARAIAYRARWGSVAAIPATRVAA